MHWYLPDNTPYHFYEKDGETIPTCKRQARKVGAAPSVSEITSQAPNGFQHAKEEKLMREAHKQGWRDKCYNAKNIREVALADWDDRRDWGSRFHSAVEEWVQFQYDYKGKEKDISKGIDEYKKWFKKNIGFVLGLEYPFYWVEHDTFNGNLKRLMPYGGTVDLLYVNTEGQVVLCDMKTKGDGKTPNKPYDQNLMQLAAYTRPMQYKWHFIDKWEVLFIEQGSGAFSVWESDPLEEYWERFECLLKYWWIDTLQKGKWGTDINAK